MKKKNINIRLFVVTVFISICAFSQQTITPTEAVALALENNYGILIANNNLEIADNNQNILNSGYLPIIGVNAGANYQESNSVTSFGGAINPNTGEPRNDIEINDAETQRYNASLDFSYTLFDGLGRYYNYKSLKKQYNLSELQARETIENTMLQLLTVYYNVARQRENLKVLEETIEISKERLTRSSYQFDYGQNTKLDVLNAEVDINNDSINIITAKQTLVNAKRDLNVVTGNAITYEFQVDTTIAFLMQLNKPNLLDKLKANNVSLLQNEKNIEINEFTLKASRSGYLPTIGLTGSYGWNENRNPPSAFFPGNVADNYTLNAGVTLRWNLFDGGATTTRVQNAKINLENQKLQKKQLAIDVERNFNNAWEDYQNRLRIYEVQQDNIKTAKNNFERTQEKFKLGQVTSIEFRQAQLNLLNAELSRNQAKYDAKIAEILVLQISGELLNVQF